MNDHQLTVTPELAFHRLGCSKGGRRLFQDVDCRLESGQWLYVTGANGVGKTSLLRMVCGLAPIEFGAIHWNGLPIDRQAEEYRQAVCYLGHLNALQETLTVRENIDFVAALGGVSVNSGSVDAALSEMGVGGRGEQLVRHLSQGQKRRVAMTRLIFSSARLWVLDEPFVALDESGIRMLVDLLSKHLHQGGLLVLTSHQVVDIPGIPAQLLNLPGWERS